jgi:pyroglutamyl-peptidase
MNKTILLTSFQPWLDHHQSNSADDLLASVALAIPTQTVNGYQLAWLRHLPVDGVLASQQTIDRIAMLQPDFVVCCGMAESYSQLTIESQANCAGVCLTTTVNIDHLIYELNETQISHDAGKFVCEALYFSVLSYLKIHQPHRHCIFVHVPILTTSIHDLVISDFCRILTNLTLI